MNTKKWTMRDGTKIRIKDMTDEHLANTVNMLRREAKRARAEMPYPIFSGEMAQYYAEQEWELLDELDDDDLAEQMFPSYSDLIDEADARKLDV